MPLLPQQGFSLEPVAAQVYQVSEMERELSDDLAASEPCWENSFVRQRQTAGRRHTEKQSAKVALCPGV